MYVPGGSAASRVVRLNGALDSLLKSASRCRATLEPLPAAP